MSTGITTTRERVPRRARYLIPKTTPRRAEFLAALGVLVVLAHLVVAQLTIVLAVIFFAITKLTRWRPQWLAVPAAAGVIWALAITPATAVSGFLAGPRNIVGYLRGVDGDPGRVMHLGAAFGGMGGWLPRQLPLALVTGAAEAAIALWLSWLHTDEWSLAAPRPGALTVIRRWYVTRAVSAGAVVTRDGACLGIAAPSGGRAALSWTEITAGVLCTGASGSGTTSTSFQLVHAAIRRRKPVIAVDLSGSRQLAEWFAIVCGATGAPLQVFSATGPACYEPFRRGDPGRRAALVMGMIDWAGTADQYRRSCGAYLNDLFAVLDATPGDPRTPLLDELAHLLNPAALRARAQHVPRFLPQRDALIERVEVSASLFEADPQAMAAPAGQLTQLRSSGLGRWLGPPPPNAAGRLVRAPASLVDLGMAVRQRGVVLFSLAGEGPGRSAAAVASLVAQDVIAVCAELRRIGVEGDGLVWFEQCGDIPARVLTELISRGTTAGLAAVLTTTSAQAADKLAGKVNAVVLHRMTDPVMAERFARITGDKLVPGDADGPQAPGGATVTAGGAGADVARGPGAHVRARGDPAAGLTAAPAFRPADAAFVHRPVVSPETLCGLGNGEFVLMVKAPQRRLVPLGKTVRARLAAPYRKRHRRRANADADRAVPRPAVPGAAAQESAPPRQPFGINGDPVNRGGDLADDHLGRRLGPAGDRQHQEIQDGDHPAPAGTARPAAPQDPKLERMIPRQSAGQRRWPA
ncbi:MAG TPA: hypothetical protein VLW50_17175 [Streptosporangiaceae bacterium]|nr:hypothetical protein [Streptosporangiaceae bacterium]